MTARRGASPETKNAAPARERRFSKNHQRSRPPIADQAGAGARRGARRKNSSPPLAFFSIRAAAGDDHRHRPRRRAFPARRCAAAWPRAAGHIELLVELGRKRRFVPRSRQLAARFSRLDPVALAALRGTEIPPSAAAAVASFLDRAIAYARSAEAATEDAEVRDWLNEVVVEIEDAEAALHQLIE